MINIVGISLNYFAEITTFYYINCSFHWDFDHREKQYLNLCKITTIILRVFDITNHVLTLHSVHFAPLFRVDETRSLFSLSLSDVSRNGCKHSKHCTIRLAHGQISHKCLEAEENTKHTKKDHKGRSFRGFEFWILTVGKAVKNFSRSQTEFLRYCKSHFVTYFRQL